MPRSTRGYVNPTCIEDRPRALSGNWPLYGKNECKGGSAVQAEAIAQARAIAQWNARGLFGKAVPISGISADLQWEVAYPGGRPDMVLYDRANPNGPLEFVEVKRSSAAARANAQLTGYLQNFPIATPRARVRRALAAYQDHFRVLVSSCRTSGARYQVIDWYDVYSDPVAGGVLLFERVFRQRWLCTSNPPPPRPEEEEKPNEEYDEWCESIIECIVAPPGQDEDKDGSDDFYEDLYEHIPELSGPVYEPALPTVLVPDGVTATVANGAVAVLEVVAAMCGSVPGFCDAAWPALIVRQGVITTEAVITALLEGLAAVAEGLVYGDPHIVTLDRLHYQLQSVGEFNFLQVPAQDLTVQARFVPLTDTASVLGPVATEVGDERIELRNGDALLNGQPAGMAKSSAIRLSETSALIRKPGGDYLVASLGPDGPVVVERESRGVRTFVADGLQTQGLVGDNDGDPDDDLVLPDGTPAPANGKESWIHGPYADAWRIEAQSSLFTYGPGEDTETYTDRSFPSDIITVTDLPDAVVSAASAQCSAAGIAAGPQFDACVFDIAVSGDETYAQDAALVDDVAVDAIQRAFDSSGELHEDFEGSIAPNFAASRYSQDASTTRVAGPLFDSPGYRFHSSNVPRHDSVDVAFDLLVYGPVTSDSAEQSIEVEWADGVRTVLDMDTVTPTVTGRVVTVASAGSGTTQNGETFRRYRVTKRRPNASDGFSLDFSSTNFRGLLETSFAIDNIDLELVVPPGNTFAIGLPATVPNPAGGALGRTSGAGRLESNGALDSYTFTLTTQQSLVFTPKNCVAIPEFRLMATGNPVPVFSQRGCWSGRSIPGLAPGTYTLEVTADNNESEGHYDFVLESVPAAQTFPYTFGSTVTNGQPAVGAGNLETIASVDNYTFSVAVAGTYKLEHLAGFLGYRVTDSTGSAIFEGWGDNQFDLVAGNYSVEFGDGHSVGAYSFKLFEVPAPQTFAYTVGTTVSNGVPATGAGNLETTASIDQYTFSIPTGGGTYRVDAGLGSVFRYRLLRAGSRVEVTSGDSSASEPIELAGGNHILEVSSAYTAAPYELRLWLVPPPQTFSYNVGTTVAEGVPSAGAGELETAESIDRYTFTIAAGAGGSYQYDPVSSVRSYRLIDVDSGEIVEGSGIAQRHNLTPGGYVLEVSAEGSPFKVGTYSFRLFKVPAPQTFGYELGTLVEPDVPANGAGRLETIASVDRYNFTVDSAQGGQHRYVRVSGFLGYQILDRSSGEIVGEGNGLENKTFNLSPDDYRIVFEASDGRTGEYSFRFRKVT